MKLFRCTCDAAPVLYFENIACESCGRLTGFAPDSLTLKPFTPAPSPSTATTGSGGGETQTWHDDDGHAYHLCQNSVLHGTCNWMVPCDEPPASLCLACRTNEVIPDLSVAGNLDLWHALEKAKRRCLFSFLELGLRFDEASTDVPPLGFRFMADGARNPPGTAPDSDEGAVTTGHANGTVTINLAEADEIARTRMQLAMEERYRTLLGHFRHETGHYFWARFAAADEGFVTAFRERFGDERADYAAALSAHYADGPPANWSATYISAYATMHPWEDWAETWAHYLHMIDTLETQQSFGVETRLETSAVRDVRLPLSVGIGEDAGHCDFDRLIGVWIDASVMLNSLNRSMGLPDPYPFVLSAAAIEKLRFVHDSMLTIHTTSGYSQHGSGG